MSYPLTRVISILILLDRGNAEGLLFINLGLFFIYYKKGEPKLYIPLLASAIAMKLYPAVFLVYLPGDRKFKDFADFGIAAALTPSAMSGRGQTLKAFTRFGLLPRRVCLLGAGRSFGHSLFGMLCDPRGYFWLDWAPGVWRRLSVDGDIYGSCLLGLTTPHSDFSAKMEKRPFCPSFAFSACITRLSDDPAFPAVYSILV